MKKVPVFILLLIIFGIVSWFVFLISQSNIQIFNPQGLIASRQRDLIFISMGIMLSVAIPVFLTACFIAWKYREGAKSIHEPNKTGGRLTLFIFVLFLSELVLVFSYIVVIGSFALDHKKAIFSETPAKTVQVVALDWKWLFIYPEENIAVINFLQVPVNTPINFKLTADGPMNSFWVPQLGGQIYSMASMETNINLIANKTGDFQGLAAEINGRGFAGMRFVARSSSETEYGNWVNWVKNSGRVLDKKEFEKLSKPSEYNPVAYYSQVDNDLYKNIMMKYMTPGKIHGRGENE